MKRGPTYENVISLIEAALMVYEDWPQIEHSVDRIPSQHVVRVMLEIPGERSFAAERYLSMINLETECRPAEVIANWVEHTRSGFIRRYVDAVHGT